MDVHDQQVIEGCVMALATDPRLKGMGIKMAFELVGCLGEWLAIKERMHGREKSDQAGD